ncbi:MAG: DUF167 domain-containing protein [Planctomycetota bacterium]
MAVRPGAQRTAVAGRHAGALKLAVAAPPEGGRANREALRFLARALKLPRADLGLLSGEASRAKVVLCRGLAPGELRARLEGLIPEP